MPRDRAAQAARLYLQFYFPKKGGNARADGESPQNPFFFFLLVQMQSRPIRLVLSWDHELVAQLRTIPASPRPHTPCEPVLQVQACLVLWQNLEWWREHRQSARATAGHYNQNGLNLYHKAH